MLQDFLTPSRLLGNKQVAELDDKLKKRSTKPIDVPVKNTLNFHYVANSIVLIKYCYRNFESK